MEDSTLNEVRDSLGGVVHELPPLSTSDWLHLPRSSFNGSRLAWLDAAKYFQSGRFRANSPHTHHHDRYTLVGASACREASPFVAPCLREADPAIPSVRADRLAGDTIADGGSSRSDRAGKSGRWMRLGQFREMNRRLAGYEIAEW